MGRNKALLPYKKVRLINHMLSLMAMLGLKKTVISGDIKGYACIPDLIPHCGPMGGIYSVMQSIQDSIENFLFIPVDMPLLTPFLLSELLQNSQQSEAIIFCDRPLPMLLNNNSLIQKQVAELLKQSKSGCSIKSLLKWLNTKTLEIPENLLLSFSNINTPHDWQKISSLD